MPMTGYSRDDFNKPLATVLPIILLTIGFLMSFSLLRKMQAE